MAADNISDVLFQALHEYRKVIFDNSPDQIVFNMVISVGQDVAEGDGSTPTFDFLEEFFIIVTDPSEGFPNNFELSFFSGTQ